MNQGPAQWGPGPQPPPPQQGNYGAPQRQGPYGQAPYGQAPHGQAPYGQAPHGQVPHGQVPHGQVPYGHPPPGQPYGAPMIGNPATAKLDSDSNTWLLVALIGFVAGFGWITGPLCWIKGGALRRDYTRMGMPPSSAATGAWVVGLISTLLMIFGMIMIALMFTLWGGLLLL